MLTRNFVMGIAIAILITIPMVCADSDHNDSLADPEDIGVGTIWGNVTEIYTGTEWNITWTIDNDCYGFTVPAKTTANFSLKKWGGREIDYIRLEFHHIDGSELKSGPYIRYMGESDWEVVDNPDPTALDIVLLVTGNGSYSLTVSTFPYVKKVPVDDRNDRSKEWKDALGIVDGTYSGSVADSTVYYRVTVPEDHLLTVEMEKTDGGIGMVYLDTFLPSDANVGWTDIQIRSTREMGISRGSWRNTYDDRVDKIVRITGDGNYTIKVTTTEEYVEPVDNDVVLAYVFMGLIFLMVASVPVLLIAILVALIVIARRSKGRKHKG